MDELVWKANFGDEQTAKYAQREIRKAALNQGVYPASIHNLYINRKYIPEKFTVPAINVRELTYDFAQTIFKVAKELNVGTLIFEIARSEMKYTDQPPAEFVASILGAAIKQNWNGPVFVQGDHFQPKALTPGVPVEREIESIQLLIKEAIEAGFYNIDIDSSTLVDLTKHTVKEQQEPNIKYMLELGNFIRRCEPENIRISIGGEIGHIGGKNSTVEDFETFMEGVGTELKLSKVSVQTGSSHGGTVLPDGTVKKVDIAFDVLQDISNIARQKYNMGGAVQHGASTLDEILFKQFPEKDTLEIHLATEFQNIILEHPVFPKDLLEKMYNWLELNKKEEWEEGWNEEQFHYKLRKKAWGQFKEETWKIKPEVKTKLMESVAQELRFLFKNLKVENTRHIIDKYI